MQYTHRAQKEICATSAKVSTMAGAALRSSWPVVCASLRGSRTTKRHDVRKASMFSCVVIHVTNTWTTASKSVRQTSASATRFAHSRNCHRTSPYALARSQAYRRYCSYVLSASRSVADLVTTPLLKLVAFRLATVTFRSRRSLTMRECVEGLVTRTREEKSRVFRGSSMPRAQSGRQLVAPTEGLVRIRRCIVQEHSTRFG